ncbi:MAG: aminotransferase class V-fold PLP-dependent enzyme, partial [Candidatus Zixiibacteriota bacterium]
MNNNLTKKFGAIRRQFPVADKSSGITYLNAASTGPLCKPVKAALVDFYNKCWYQNQNNDIPAFAALDNIRKIGAKMIGARAAEVGFGFSTGFGLNVAAYGLPLKRGDEVLLSDIEFPANVYPWVGLKVRGIKVKFIKSIDRKFDIDNFKKAISKKSRVLSLSFVQFFNGYKNDLKTIGEICKDHGLYFVVDGIQGCGAEPIDVDKCKIDIFSAGAQKWMLSPQGAGFFFVRKDLQNGLQMPWMSWLSVEWGLQFGDLFHYDKEPFDSARKFEMGTYPYSHVHAMSEALNLIDSVGVKNIQQHNHELIDILIEYI